MDSICLLGPLPQTSQLFPPAQASSPPRPDPTPQQQQNRSDRSTQLVRPVWVTRGSLQHSGVRNLPPSSINCLGSYLACVHSHHVIETRLHEERKARKKLQKDMNEVKKTLYPNKTPFPSGSEERESNPPTPFEQRYANYENFDLSHPFALYPSTSHMGFDSQFGGDFEQEGPSFDAPSPLPPPEQLRPSMADQIVAYLFGALNPGMASGSHTSLHHNTMPPFFDSSIYTRPGSHWAPPHDYAPSDDQ
jgi:hypothetical protein